MKKTTILNQSFTEVVNNVNGDKIGDFLCDYNHEEGKKPEQVVIKMNFGGGVIHVSGDIESVENISNQFSSNLSKVMEDINLIGSGKTKK